MKNISVIGAGQMGNGIAHVFAQGGHSVTLIDIAQDRLDKAVATIGKNMDRQVAKGGLTEDQKQAALARIATSTDLATGVKAADLVVEAATENVDLKLKIFRELNKINRLPGYAGPPSPAAAEAVNKYILVDMFAKACTGQMTPREAVAWAETEYAQIARRRNRG